MSEMLPENVSEEFDDRTPGDTTHQHHHDVIHQRVNTLPGLQEDLLATQQALAAAQGDLTATQEALTEAETALALKQDAAALPEAVETTLGDLGLPTSGADLSASTAASINTGSTNPQVAVDARAALALTRVAPDSDFTALPHVGYGNSYGNPQGASGNATPWSTLFATEHEATYANRWVNGAQMQDTAQDAIGSATRKWTTGDASLVMVGDPINDIGWQQSDTQALAGFKEALRALIYVLRSTSRLESSDWTYAGSGWSQISTASLDLSGGSMRQGNAPTGAATTPTFTTTAANEKVALLTYVKNNSQGATIDVKLDGATVSSKVTANVGRASNNKSTRDYIACVIPITVPTAGDHVVSVERTGGGNLVYIDALLRFAPSVLPPTVLVQKAVKPTDAAYVNFYGVGKTDSPRATYNAAIDEIVAEFPADGRVVVADANKLRWNSAVHQGNDGLHPSAAGHQRILRAAKVALHESL